MKVHYTFNYRECFKFVTSFCKIEGNYLKTEAHVVKLFYHEAMRQYADKILMKHDLQWFMETLKQVCLEEFDLTPDEEGDTRKQTGDAGEASEKGEQPAVSDNVSAAVGFKDKSVADTSVTGF